MELQNQFNYQYYATFYFGSNKQPLNLLFDTGSWWTWVPTEKCPVT